MMEATLPNFDRVTLKASSGILRYKDRTNLHMTQSARNAEEEGSVMISQREKDALAVIRDNYIKATRKFPLAQSNPLSFWANCFANVAPRSGLLVELIVKSCGIEASLKDLAPCLEECSALSWLDLSENVGLTGEVEHLSGLAGHLTGLDLHDTMVDGDLSTGLVALAPSLEWVSVSATQVGGTLDRAVVVTDAGKLRHLDVSLCANLRGTLPARFERASRFTVIYRGTELVPEDLIGTGKSMPGGYAPTSHPLQRRDMMTLSVW
mmetsp:Transcript_32418/g.66111  ORF Transcript_32418/g.66111 Transcript_32418/m.66111 type:complete len:265 (-) Transcript_32418:185-979(-)